VNENAYPACLGNPPEASATGASTQKKNMQVRIDRVRDSADTGAYAESLWHAVAFWIFANAQIYMYYFQYMFMNDGR